MASMIRRYTHWLHTRWPAGHVEKLPQVNQDGSTSVPGLYVVGDITGIPLLKFSAHTGARAVQTIVSDSSFQNRDSHEALGSQPVFDLVIVGAGVSGMAAALEARKHELSFRIIEAAQPFSTVVNFPRRKPIYTYPTDMTPAGELQFSEKSDIKEGLVEELYAQTIRTGIEPIIARVDRVVRKGRLLEVVVAGGENLLAHRVIVAIGRSGNFRKLGVPGEDLDKVYNRLHDPRDFCGRDVLVIGGGDSALETAIAVASCGSRVTLSYRKPQFSRPKPENIENLDALAADPMADVAVENPVSERVTTSAGGFLNEHRKPGSVRLMMASKLKEIRENEIVITDSNGREETIPNDAVFTMIGREAPLGFFRRSGIPIAGEMTARNWIAFGLFAAFCVFLFHWKKDLGLPVNHWFVEHNWFPYNVPQWFAPFGQAANTPGHLLFVLKSAMAGPTFYYTLAYCLCVVVFGVRRIRRRRTPYIKVQTLVLMAIQCIPLFLLPEIILPWMGQNGAFDGGVLGWVAHQLFPGESYWRAYGLILAWPLFVANFFTDEPLWGWLLIGSVQTFVLIPAMIYFWGKGAYCGWICPCGALAETMGDAHRQKMPHGPFWNRLNMVGQVILGIAGFMMILRILGWMMPGSVFAAAYGFMLKGIPILSYSWFVDLFLAGIVGVACYFWFSGRVWCRFACPLAALMHVYARFSRFRILADKKKCISCNVCTSVCHQGIDVMNFANKGLPMEDPQCVRCSACVQSCPTGVLTFGQIDRRTGRTLKTDALQASPVQMAELTVNGISRTKA